MMRTNRRFFLHKGIGLSVALAALRLWGAPDATVSDYMTATNKKVVVATPVGYQQELKLITGETVRIYPTALPPEAVSNCTAVLFCVLSPDALRGKYLLLSDSGCCCPMCEPLKPWPEQYAIGSHYYIYRINSDFESRLFELGHPHWEIDDRLDRMVWPVSRNVQEADIRLADLERKHLWATNRLEQLEGELARLPKEPQDEREKKKREAITYGIGEATLSINEYADTKEDLLAERDWLSRFPGGAITNRVEPLRLRWNGYLRKLAETPVPQLGYRGTTLEEILEYLEKRFGKHYCRVRIEGNYPNDVKWVRKHDLTVPAGSLLDVLVYLGGLDHVRLDLKGVDHYDSIYFFVSGDEAMIDWSTSVFMEQMPDTVLEDVTFREVSRLVINSLNECCFKKNKGLGRGNIRKRVRYSCAITDQARLEARHRFSFQGKTFREAIRMIDEAFGVHYDYPTETWRELVR